MQNQSKSDQTVWQPLTISLLLIAAGCSIFVRQLPENIRPWNFAPAGAMFLLAGSRVRSWYFLLIPFAAQILLDWSFHQGLNWEMPIVAYVSFGVYLFFGWWLLRNTESIPRIGLVTILGSIQFFLITNFMVWMDHVLHPELYQGTGYYYPPTIEGLILCFEMAIPFFRGTLISDLFFSSVFFGLYAWLSRSYFVDERIGTSLEHTR
jgi:hypothetical protein